MFGDVPSYDELALVITCSITERTPRRIHESVRAVLGRGRSRRSSTCCRRRVLRDRGGGRVATRQRTCGGACERRPRELGGVYVDPETLRWFCAACWDADVDRVAAIVGRSG